MIKKRWVKSIYVKELYCDDCGSKMEATGVALLSLPPQIEFMCPTCKKVDYVWETEGIGQLHYEYDNEEIL